MFGCAFHSYFAALGLRPPAIELPFFGRCWTVYCRRVCGSAMAKLEKQGSIFLRASREIEAVKRCGRRLSTDVFNVLICTMGDGQTRFGIVVGKRFGNAVRRNRIKRVFRALIRECHAELVPGHAAIVFPKREAMALPFKSLKQVWRHALERVKLLRSRCE